MNDKEIIEILIDEYKSLPRKRKSEVPSSLMDAIHNYNTGRSSGMSVKTLVKLANSLGFEITICKKENFINCTCCTKTITDGQ